MKLWMKPLNDILKKPETTCFIPGAKALFAILEDADADIICLQEVSPGSEMLFQKDGDNYGTMDMWVSPKLWHVQMKVMNLMRFGDFALHGQNVFSTSGTELQTLPFLSDKCRWSRPTCPEFGCQLFSPGSISVRLSSCPKMPKTCRVKIQMSPWSQVLSSHGWQDLLCTSLHNKRTSWDSNGFSKNATAGWWFETSFISPETVGNIIIPTDKVIFFRGAQPPTRHRDFPSICQVTPCFLTWLRQEWC